MVDIAKAAFLNINHKVQESFMAKRHGDFGVALQYCENALELALLEITRLSSTFQECKLNESPSSGLLDAVYATPTKVAPIGVFGMPRSGTTFITRALRCLTGIPVKDVSVQPPFISTGRLWLRGNDMDAVRMMDACLGGEAFIMHNHPMPTPVTEALIRQHGIRVVFNNRSLLDCLLSTFEIVEKQVSNNFGAMLEEGGGQWAPLRLGRRALSNYMALSQEDRLDFVLDLAAPWFVQYLAGWEELLARIPLAVNLPYSAIVDSEQNALSYLMKRLNLSCDENRIAEYLDSFHRNKPFYLVHGVEGRGRNALSSGQFDRIYKLAVRYGGVDFAARYVV